MNHFINHYKQLLFNINNFSFIEPAACLCSMGKLTVKEEAGSEADRGPP